MIIGNTTRYWCELGLAPSLTDHGFIYNSDLYVDRVKDLEELRDNKCLLLLGEPESGKTNAITKILEVHDKKYSEQALYFDLGNIISESELEVFINHLAEKAKSTKDRIYAYIDNFEDGQRYFPVLHRAFSRYIEQHKELLQATYIRVCSSSFYWDERIEATLISTWGKENCGKYILQPLSLNNLKYTLEGKRDYLEFIGELEANDYTHFATRPKSLEWLLSNQINGQNHPPTMEFIKSGIRTLIRGDRSLVNSLNCEQLFVINCRIAYVLSFCQKMGINLNVAGNLQPDFIDIGDLLNYPEDIYESQLILTEAHICQAIDSKLYKLVQPNCFAFSGKSIQDFLTAQYIIRHHVSFKRLLALIEYPLNREIQPRFYGVVKNLVAAYPELFDYLSENDPLALLCGVHYELSDEQKENIVGKLLHGNVKFYQIISNSDMRSKLRWLYHRRLSTQIQSVINSKNATDDQRIIALEIVQQCQMDSFSKVLVQLAFSDKESILLRRSALYALRELNCDKEKIKLKKLLLENDLSEDVDDELRGYLLQILWPKHLNIKQLVNSLTPIKSRSYYGAYRFFLNKAIVNDLTNVSDIRHFFLWVEKQDNEDYGYGFIRELKDTLLAKLFTLPLLPSTLDLIAEILMSKAVAYEHFESDMVNKLKPYLEGGTTRKALILKLVSKTPEKHQLTINHFLQVLFMREEDIPFYIEQIKSQKSQKKLSFVLLARNAYNLDSQPFRDQLLDFYTTQSKTSTFYRYFKYVFGPVSIDDEEHKRLNSFEATDQRKQLFNPNERVIEILEYAEQDGKAGLWQNLVRDLSLDGYSNHYRDFDTDIVNLIGWKSATGLVRSRIRQLGKRFLNEFSPNTFEWLGTNVSSNIGLLTFRFLHQDQPGALEHLSVPIWEKWTPEILGCIQNTQDDITDLLVKKAYENAKLVFLKALDVIIEKSPSFDTSLFGLQRIECLGDTNLDKYIFEAFKTKKITDDARLRIVEYLMKRKNSQIIKYVESKLKNISANDSEATYIAKLAYYSTIYELGIQWKHIWKAIQTNSKFAQVYFEQLSWRCPNLSNYLTEAELAAWYLLLYQQYPPEEDPNTEGAHIVTPRESIGHLRHNVLNQLTGYGTEQAYKQIAKLMKALPEQENTLIHCLSQAKAVHRLPPMNPQQALTWLKQPSSQYIQHGEHLINLVIDSLERLQNRLLGETPVARTYWNQVSTDEFTPFKETDISNNIKNHLVDDLTNKGILVNREVEIRAILPKQKRSGQKPDLLIQVANKTGHSKIVDIIQLTVEIKANWSKDVVEEMENQLSSRYLKNNDKCQTGLYLVVYFPPEPLWKNDNNKRLASKPDRSLSKLKSNLNAKAKELTDIHQTVKSYVLEVPISYAATRRRNPRK